MLVYALSQNTSQQCTWITFFFVKWPGDRVFGCSRWQTFPLLANGAVSEWRQINSAHLPVPLPPPAQSSSCRFRPAPSPHSTLAPRIQAPPTRITHSPALNSFLRLAPRSSKRPTIFPPRSAPDDSAAFPGPPVRFQLSLSRNVRTFTAAAGEGKPTL